MSQRQFALITAHVNRVTAVMRIKLFASEEKAWNAIHATNAEREAGLVIRDETWEKYIDRSESWVREVVNGELLMVNDSYEWLDWRGPVADIDRYHDYGALPDLSDSESDSND